MSPPGNPEGILPSCGNAGMLPPPGPPPEEASSFITSLSVTATKNHGCWLIALSAARPACRRLSGGPDWMLIRAK